MSMSKNWMFKGFNVNEASESDEIRTSVNQGKFMLKIAEKLKIMNS